MSRFRRYAPSEPVDGREIRHWQEWFEEMYNADREERQRFEYEMRSNFHEVLNRLEELESKLVLSTKTNAEPLKQESIDPDVEKVLVAKAPPLTLIDKLNNAFGDFKQSHMIEDKEHILSQKHCKSAFLKYLCSLGTFKMSTVNKDLINQVIGKNLGRAANVQLTTRDKSKVAMLTGVNVDVIADGPLVLQASPGWKHVALKLGPSINSPFDESRKRVIKSKKAEEEDVLTDASLEDEICTKQL